MKKLFAHTILFSAIALAIAACSRTPEWKLQGHIDGVESSQMILEAATHGVWLPIDTIVIGGDGAFDFSRPAGRYPNIYRLSLGDKHIYIPVDSTESLTLTANAASFDQSYDLTGSTAADIITDVDRRLMKAVAEKGVTVALADSVFKRQLAEILLKNPSGIEAYYIINKQIGGIPVFDPENRGDLRIIGAIANAYDREHPDDPRSTHLKNMFLTHRASMPFPSDTIVASTISFPALTLYDNTGKQHDLQQTAKANKVVILNFTAYTASESPAINIELNKIYEQYHKLGLEIYQVAIDNDEYQWKQSAKNLPWITVYNSPLDGAQNLLNFNVRALPATFIIANGELVDRADQVSTIAGKVARYF